MIWGSIWSWVGRIQELGPRFRRQRTAPLPSSLDIKGWEGSSVTHHTSVLYFSIIIDGVQTFLIYLPQFSFLRGGREIRQWSKAKLPAFWIWRITLKKKSGDWHRVHNFFFFTVRALIKINYHLPWTTFSEKANVHMREKMIWSQTKGTSFKPNQFN